MHIQGCESNRCALFRPAPACSSPSGLEQRQGLGDVGVTQGPVLKALKLLIEIGVLAVPATASIQKYCSLPLKAAWPREPGRDPSEPCCRGRGAEALVTPLAQDRKTRKKGSRLAWPRPPSLCNE